MLGSPAHCKGLGGLQSCIIAEQGALSCSKSLWFPGNCSPCWLNPLHCRKRHWWESSVLEWWGINRRSLEASCFRWRSRKWFLPRLRARDLLHWRISRGGHSWLCYKICLHYWFVSLSTYITGSEPGVWTLDLAYGTHHTAMEPVVRACVCASRLQQCAALLLWWEQTGCHSPFVWLKVPTWPWWCCKAFMSPSLEKTNDLDYSPCSCPGSCYALVLILWTKHLRKKLILSKCFKWQITPLKPLGNS